MPIGHPSTITVGGAKNFLSALKIPNELLLGFPVKEIEPVKNVKAGRPLIDFIKLCYLANKPPLLIGKHGCGKSMLLEQVAKELGISYICRDLSLMEPPDLVGMPKLAGGVTRFLPPAFLPTEGRGILAFEELNRCPSYMRAPCLQLLTARCLNDYTLPSGWLPCAAINPSEDGYEVNDLDKALLSRFVKCHVIPDKGEWIRWADANGIRKDVIGYIQSDSQIFKDTSPRDWCMVSALMDACEGIDKIPSIPRNERMESVMDISSIKGCAEILPAALQGVIGKDRCVSFSTFLKNGILLPKVADILADYPTYAKQIVTWREEGKTDLLGNLAHELMVHLQDGDNYIEIRKEKASWIALSVFLENLPPDTARTISLFMSQMGYEVPKYGKEELSGENTEQESITESKRKFSKPFIKVPSVWTHKMPEETDHE